MTSLFLMFYIITNAGLDKVFGASLDVGGTEGKYVTLLCGPSASSSVEWWDYGTDGTFTSTPLKMAKGSTVDPSYSNQNRIFVNASNNYSLTINKLQFSDEKYYKCSGGLSYHLFVMGVPQCTGETKLVIDQQSELKCTVTYGAKQPILEWKQNRKRRATQSHWVTLQVEGFESEHGNIKECIATLAGHSETCSLTISVQYKVAFVELFPRFVGIEAGKDVTCEAMSNPSPLITIKVDVEEGSLTYNSRSVRMMSKWAGRNITVTCEASNEVAGETHSVRAQQIYNVLASNYSDPPTTEKSTEDDVLTASIPPVAVVVIILSILAIAAFIVFLLWRMKKIPLPNCSGKQGKSKPTEQQLSNIDGTEKSNKDKEQHDVPGSDDGHVEQAQPLLNV